METAPLAITMGEPAGIGGELALAAWLKRQDEHLAPFLAIDCPDRLRLLSTSLGWHARIKPVSSAAEAMAVFAEALPVIPVDGPVEASPGKPTSATARAVISSIETAVRLTLAGDCTAIVTNPIQKSVLTEAGFQHPGHTEFIAELCGRHDPVMMLAIPGLRVVPATIHVPLAAVPGLITTQSLVELGRVTAAALRRDFGVAEPRLALSGLNPHAGEDATIGTEERDIIHPAADALRSEGIAVVGPLPADSLFQPRLRPTYDAALCLYHDQALIPIKTLDPDRGVNVTLGLPIVRTSPDHGTALDIAGCGIAHPDSLIAAMRMATDMAGRRAATAAAAA